MKNIPVRAKALLTKCPCGSDLAVTEDSVIHEWPMCDDFSRRDPTEFLRWLNDLAAQAVIR